MRRNRQLASLDHSNDLVGPRVPHQSEPAVAAVLVEPTFRRGPFGVGDHPGAVEVGGVGVDERGRDGGNLTAEAELLDRTDTADRAGDVQWVPEEPRSAMGRSSAKRLSPKGAIRGGVRPVAINSAMASPAAGMALKPQVPQPVVTRNPSTS